MALQDWTMYVNVDGVTVATIPVKKKKVPQRGQKIRIRYGLPEGPLRDGTYEVIHVREQFSEFTIEPAGKLAPRFEGIGD